MFYEVEYPVEELRPDSDSSWIEADDIPNGQSVRGWQSREKFWIVGFEFVPDGSEYMGHGYYQQVGHRYFEYIKNEYGVDVRYKFTQDALEMLLENLIDDIPSDDDGGYED